MPIETFQIENRLTEETRTVDALSGFWDIMRLINRGDQDIFAQIIASIENMIAPDSIDRVVAISRRGIVLGSIVSAFFGKKLSILELAPYKKISPTPKRWERCLIIDDHMKTGFAISLGRRILKMYNAQPIKSLCAFKYDVPMGEYDIESESIRQAYKNTQHLMAYRFKDDGKEIRPVPILDERNSLLLPVHVTVVKERILKRVNIENVRTRKEIAETLSKICKKGDIIDFARLYNHPLFIIDLAKFLCRSMVDEETASIIASCRFSLPIATIMAICAIFSGKKVNLNLMINEGAEVYDRAELAKALPSTAVVVDVRGLEMTIGQINPLKKKIADNTKQELERLRVPPKRINLFEDPSIWKNDDERKRHLVA